MFWTKFCVAGGRAGDVVGESERGVSNYNRKTGRGRGTKHVARGTQTFLMPASQLRGSAYSEWCNPIRGGSFRCRLKRPSYFSRTKSGPSRPAPACLRCGMQAPELKYQELVRGPGAHPSPQTKRRERSTVVSLLGCEMRRSFGLVAHKS